MSLSVLRRQSNGIPTRVIPYAFFTYLLVRSYAMPAEMKIEFSAAAGSQGVVA